MPFSAPAFHRALLILILSFCFSGRTYSQNRILRALPLNQQNPLILIQMNLGNSARQICLIDYNPRPRGNGIQITSTYCDAADRALSTPELQLLGRYPESTINTMRNVRQSVIHSDSRGSTVSTVRPAQAPVNYYSGVVSSLIFAQNPQAQGWNSQLNSARSRHLVSTPNGIINRRRKTITPYRALDLTGAPVPSEFEFGAIQRSTNPLSVLPLQAYYQPPGQTHQTVPQCDTVDPVTHLPQCISDGTLPRGHIVASYNRHGLLASLILPSWEGTASVFYNLWYLYSLQSGSCAAEVANENFPNRKKDPDDDPDNCQRQPEPLCFRAPPQTSAF